MHIVFLVTRADAVGGATIHVRDMARGLVEHGERVTVLVGGRGEALDEFVRHRLTCRSLPLLGRAINPIKDPLALAHIAATLASLKPDLVCTHTAKAGLLGRAACAVLGIPVVYTPHGWTISDRVSRSSGRFFRVMERAAGHFTSRIINVCEAERQLAREHRIATEDKLAVVHNGVHDVAEALRARPSQDPPRLAMVARFEEPKDHATLLHALLAVAHLPWQLELIGSGPRRNDVRRLAATLGMESRIVFTSGADVASRLAQAQIFVLSSRSEGFPLSILEAMRAGLPVVASGVGGVSEAVDHGISGFVVRPGDPASLAGALLPLLIDGKLRSRLGEEGRRRYERQFTFSAMFTRTLELYHSILAPAAGKALVAQEGI